MRLGLARLFLDKYYRTNITQNKYQWGDIPNPFDEDIIDWLEMWVYPFKVLSKLTREERESLGFKDVP